MSALRLLILAALAAGAFFLAACAAPSNASNRPFQSTVKVETRGGHGSGFYIGGGLVVTAAHVVDDMKTVNLKLVDGSIIEAEVLWGNAKRDIALLKIEPTPDLVAPVVSCVEPKVGQRIYAEGNPANLDFIRVWGAIGGDGLDDIGPWHRAFVTDIATVPGQSGGPVFNERGEVIGITVGVMVSRLGFSGSYVGIGYIVPTAELCKMMGW